MRLSRRRCLHLATGAAVMPALALPASALDYPTRPVHLIVGFAAGGTPDLVARLLAQRLSERLGQPFVIDDRPGAGSSIGAEAAVRAAPDGYTLLTATAANATNATFYDNLSFNFPRDIAPVATVMRTPFVLVVNPLVPARTLAELIAYAKANPGKITFASSGIGTALHLAGELLKLAAGIDIVHVPYRGSALALPDLLAGQVQAMFDTVPSAIGYIKAGKERALAVTVARRLDVLPNVPAVAEFVPGYEASGWIGIGAPKGTPAEIVDVLNKEINAALSDPKMRARLAELGGQVASGSAADFGKLMADETEKWGKVIRAANIKPE